MSLQLLPPWQTDTIGPSFASYGHMGCRHDRNISQNLASTAIQLDSKFRSKQHQSNLSDLRVWKGSRVKSGLAYGGYRTVFWKRLHKACNCHSHSPRTHYVRFCFCRKTRLPVSWKTHFDWLFPAHFLKCIEAQLIRGCFALNGLFGQASSHFSPPPSPTV